MPHVLYITGAPMVLVEYAPYGNLRDFLRCQRPQPPNFSGYEQPRPLNNGDMGPKPLTFKDLVSFSFQVARAMEYLASKKVSDLSGLQ